MKKLTTTLALAALAFGCSKREEEGTVQKSVDPGSAAAKPAEPAKPETPKTLSGADLAQKYQACVGQLNAGKLDEFRKDCIDSGYVGHAFAGMPETKGADARMVMFKDQRTSFPDWKLEPQLIMVSGRNILAVNLVTGTNSGPLKTPMGEMPATDKRIGLLMFHRLKLNDANMATDEWAVVDVPTMMGQLGVSKSAEPARAPMVQGIEGAPIVLVTADDAKEKANLEAVKKGNDAFVANKVPELMATLADDATESDQSGPRDVQGKKEIEKNLTTFRNAWSDVKVSNAEMWAAGDYVIQVMKFEGKHDKDLGKLKKTGKTVALDVVEVMRFKDGKIDRMWRFGNSMDFAMQLGLMPPPGTTPPAAK